MAVWIHIRTRRNIVEGDPMNVGDLVIYENVPDRIGIVMNQVGVVDRWVVLWPSGSLEAFWSIDLEVISENR